MAALESLIGGGGVVLGPADIGLHRDEEEEDDSPVVN